MILETMDWIFFITVFILLSAVFYFSIKGILHVQYTFILATGLIGSIMLWGFIHSDPTTLPVWIQAGATTMLLVITGMSTYAALEMAKVTQNQALMQVKELKRELIIEFSGNTIQAIRSILKRESQFLDSGFVIALYKTYQKAGKNENIHYQTPCGVFKDLIPVPDSILQKYLEQIYQSNKKFDDYAKQLDSLLNRILEKENNFIDEFNMFCTTLPNPDKSTILEHKEDDVFALALSDSTSEYYPKYNFFNYYRQVLISKLIDAGFKPEMDDYKKIKESFSEIKEEYNTIFKKLHREWKEEYFVKDSDLKFDEQFI